MSEMTPDIMEAAMEVLKAARPAYDSVEQYDTHWLAVASAILAERERCAKICEQQAQVFLSPQYAANQPIGSICERFACEECAAAIRTPSTGEEQ